MKHLIFDDETLNLPLREEKRKSPKKEVNFKPPVALKAGTDWDGDLVEITSEVYAEPVPDWDTLLSETGYDPNDFEVMEPVKVSTWDVQNEEGVKRLYSYKFGIRTKQTTTYRDEDYRELVQQIKKHRPLKKELPDGDAVFVLNLADWQLGKADGDGTHGTVERILKLIDDAERRVDELNKLGRNIGTIVIAGVGDMQENCDGNYATQTYTVELNRRQQLRLLRRLLVKLITTLAKKAPRVIVLSVPGNHGENRKDGKYYTTRGDNDDVSVFEAVYEILGANAEAYGHVEFVLPEDEIYLTLQVSDKILGWFHGHVTSGGADPMKKIHDWWKNQTFCGEQIGQADILVTGHYHHFIVVEYDDDKIHMQCPSLDGGSEWYRDLKGVNSRPGTLSFVVDNTKPYRDLEIL